MPVGSVLVLVIIPVLVMLMLLVMPVVFVVNRARTVRQAKVSMRAGVRVAVHRPAVRMAWIEVRSDDQMTVATGR